MRRNEWRWRYLPCQKSPVQVWWTDRAGEMDEKWVVAKQKMLEREERRHSQGQDFPFYMTRISLVTLPTSDSCYDTSAAVPLQYAAMFSRPVTAVTPSPL
ncbi:predicted protein [Sclerotinia sclerotiorum 1980 UF-70]|uniref:Uncharacterized protein n=1 Tax=Sclerotinia sclerotiorum (strain ATCC 18683 / 1980 / Ss-1) TaxID=665079 RepID=A7EC01_SCLS1|nr:predicted protein [Sclerotinia sclerotiorum 1980 UF-70]EDN99979.1 predicted protein [Sclerotinia sclerotiorum 1980 UF-70]